MRWLTNFDDFMVQMNSYKQELEYTLLKPDCHSWGISKMQSDILEERYAIKLYFKLEKNATETYRILQAAFGASCMNWASVFWVAYEIQGRQGVCEGWWGVCGWSKEGNTPELIDLRVRVRVTMLRALREYRKRFRRKRPALFKIGSVAFPPGQCTSPQLHPCPRLFDQDWYQGSCSASL